MAKKNSHISNASVRRLKEQKKLEERQAYFRAHKKQIITAACIAVAAILVIALAVDFFYTPAGSLPMFMGQLQDVKETSIVRQVGDRGLYFELGNMEKPEGFEVAEYPVISSEPTQEKLRYFESADAESPVKNIFVSGVAGRSGKEMLDNATMALNMPFKGEKSEAEIAGHKVNYLYYHNPAEEGATDRSATLLMYVDTIQNSCILVQCITPVMPEADLPTEETLLELAPSVLSCLTVPSK